MKEGTPQGEDMKPEPCWGSESAGPGRAEGREDRDVLGGRGLPLPSLWGGLGDREVPKENLGKPLIFGDNVIVL